MADKQLYAFPEGVTSELLEKIYETGLCTLCNPPKQMAGASGVGSHLRLHGVPSKVVWGGKTQRIGSRYDGAPSAVSRSSKATDNHYKLCPMCGFNIEMAEKAGEAMRQVLKG